MWVGIDGQHRFGVIAAVKIVILGAVGGHVRWWQMTYRKGEGWWGHGRPTCVLSLHCCCVEFPL